MIINTFYRKELDKEEEMKHTEHINEQLTPYDRCRVFKIILMAFLIAYMVILIIILGTFSSFIPRQNQEGILISFFFSITIGYFVLNPLRIFLICLYLRQVVRNQQRVKPAFCPRLIDFFLMNHEVREMMRDI